MARRQAPSSLVSTDDDAIAVRLLPHSLEAEKTLLGALLINPTQIDRVASTLQPKHFFRLAHRMVYAAIVTLALERHAEVDLVTVKDELAKRGEMDEVGGPAYLSALTDGVPRSTHIKQYASIVQEKAALREIIRTANTMMGAAYDAERDAKDIVGEADQAIVALQRHDQADRLVDLRSRFSTVLERLQWHEAHKGELLGVDTGFPAINDLTNGWMAGDLIVLAARPSIGKTALALNTAVAAAKTGKRVAIFSLEMRLQQLEYRILSNLSGVPLSKIQSGYMGEDDYQAVSTAMADVNQLPILVNDRGGQTAVAIRSQCRQIQSDGGLDLVLVDYVQLMPSSLERRGATTRTEQIDDTALRLKTLADEVQCPVILMSQLNRAGDKRSDKRPILSDLRESGALEQHADLVIFLHRKHHLENGKTEFIIEKQRNGPGGTVNLLITRQTQTFVEAPADMDTPEDAAPEAPPERRKPARTWKRAEKAASSRLDGPESD